MTQEINQVSSFTIRGKTISVGEIWFIDTYPDDYYFVIKLYTRPKYPGDVWFDALLLDKKSTIVKNVIVSSHSIYVFHRLELKE
jgi:hypothetical protein